MARQPTTLQLAQYGETALVIRKAMKAKGLTAKMVNEAMGLRPANTAIYQMANGKMPVGPKIRPRLAQALGLDESTLLPKPLMSGQEALSVAPMPRDAPSPDSPRSMPRKAGNSLLAFTVDQAGVASMQFNLQMPLAQAIELLNELQAKGLLNG